MVENKLLNVSSQYIHIHIVVSVSAKYLNEFSILLLELRSQELLLFLIALVAVKEDCKKDLL